MVDVDDGFGGRARCSTAWYGTVGGMTIVGPYSRLPETAGMRIMEASVPCCLVGRLAGWG
jgi:hypothetical protein